MSDDHAVSDDHAAIAAGTAAGTAADAGTAAEDPLFIIAAGEPTAEEFAALSVVLQGVIDELTTAPDGSDNRHHTAWQRSQRPLRTAINHGHDAWRSFSA